MVPRNNEIVGKILLKVIDHVKDFKVGELAGVGCMVDSLPGVENCKNDFRTILV